MNDNLKKERVYLDWAAATPLSSSVLSAMKTCLENDFGNPNAIHKEGAKARQGVETAREQIAKAVEVRPEFVTFISGGTEGNNLVILGVIENLHQRCQDYSSMEVIITRIEHSSISKTIEHLKTFGVVVKYVKVDDEGKIELSHLKELLSDKTVLVSFAYANSEIGTIQAVRGVRRIINEAEGRFGNKINLHIDAAQAPLWLPCQLEKIGADFLVLDAAKCCGPKGVGVLIRSHRAKISSIAFGGGQEQGLRPGTENVAGIVGAGVAIMEAQSNWQERAEKVSKVRDVGIQFLLQNIPRVILNGVKGEERLANNINISVLGLDTEYATVVLDNKGFAVSTKSACAGAGGGESVVVKTTSDDPARASSTLRISLGPDTTIDDLEKLTRVLSVHVKKMDSIVN